MQAEAGTDPKTSRVTALPAVLVLLGAAGTALLWEPLTGVFARSVQFNAIGTAAFALWAAISVAGLIASLRIRKADQSAVSRVVLVAAALLTCLVVTTWIFIIATGAIGTGTASSGSFPLR
jgi:hypothetical protein